MEDLFGGECNMFNPAATKDSDEDQPAGSQTLLQRAHAAVSQIESADFVKITFFCMGEVDEVRGTQLYFFI